MLSTIKYDNAIDRRNRKMQTMYLQKFCQIPYKILLSWWKTSKAITANPANSCERSTKKERKYNPIQKYNNNNNNQPTNVDMVFYFL